MNLIPNSSLFKLLLFCFLCLSLVNCEDDQTCIMSDTCGFGVNGPVPCAQTSSPIKFTDEKDLKLLNEMCPSLKDGPVCCQPQQLVDMKTNMQLLMGFKKCATCLYNFMDLFCQSTCNPKQNKFFVVTKTENADDDDEITMLNGTITQEAKRQKVSAISYSIKYDDAKLMYNSCSLAYSASLQQSFRNLFGDANNAKELFYGIGHLSPFVFDFLFFDGDRTFKIDDDKNEVDVPRTTEAALLEFKNCNETTRNGETCRCSQCDFKQCPLIPGVEISEQCLILDFISCSSFVIFDVYSLILIISIIFFVRYLRNKNSDERDSEILENEKDEKLSEGFGVKMERFFGQFFEWWTRICVRHPYLVILFGILIVVGLSLGLLNFTVISDPVELWSSPASTARQQREYYNAQFNPFFRVQQIIIKRSDPAPMPIPGSVSDLDPSTTTAPTTTDSTTNPTTNPTTTLPPSAEPETISNLFEYEFMKQAFYLQNNITSLIATLGDKKIKLNDVCYDPMKNNHCAIQSPFTWFQENITTFREEEGQYYTKIKNCFTKAVSDRDCFGSYGGPAFPYVALGGYKDKDYSSATAIIITILLDNHVEEKDNLEAMEWEQEFLNFTSGYIGNLTSNSPMKISYYSERSVADELLRQSLSDVATISISYVIMFVYVSMALGQLISTHKLFIDSKIGLAIVGVLIVLASVSSSVGFLSLCGVKATLIIVEVIPFLVLAVGVDNIFIIVQTLNRENNHDELIEDKMARIMSKVGPSLLLAFLSEVACFFLGAMSSMPCIRIFALNAALALVFDFLLQMTVFLAFLSLDFKRQKEARYDILVCIKSKKSNANEDLSDNHSLLYNFFNNIYAPFLMKDVVRFIVLVIFSLALCIACMVVKDVDVGLDQELSMPEDSYVNRYFLDQKTVLRVGPPMFFVLKNPIDVKNAQSRAFIADYNDSSLVSSIKAKSLQENTYIATGANSWIDGYDSFVASDECFQVFKETVKKGKQYCPVNTVERFKNCERDDSLIDSSNEAEIKIKPEYYYKYLNAFLNEPPSPTCPYGGRAQYKDAVKLITQNKQTLVESSYFMAYHTVLQSSEDFVNAYDDAKLTSKYLEEQINQHLPKDQQSVEVFPYSIFYVFYDQFLTMWTDAIFSLSISLIAILLVTFVLTGFDLRNTLIFVFTLISILFNILSVMYWWNISLNAVSLVNLVMSIGISVEFCSHILHYYCTNSHPNSKLCAQNALAKMGSSVFSGIALTKFVGIVVLANSHSQIFQIFYFRMYLTIVLVGSTHGLILLPVLLSIFGGKAKLRTDSSN